MMDRVDINRLLVEMRAIKQQTMPTQSMALRDVADKVQPLQSPHSAPKTDAFGDMFSKAIDSVNSVQQASGQMAKAYEAGDPSVDITDVMIASQKASVSFQAMVQVRNKLVDAYRDVMNMPI